MFQWLEEERSTICAYINTHGVFSQVSPILKLSDSLLRRWRHFGGELKVGPTKEGP